MTTDHFRHRPVAQFGSTQVRGQKIPGEDSVRSTEAYLTRNGFKIGQEEVFAEFPTRSASFDVALFLASRLRPVDLVTRKAVSGASCHRGLNLRVCPETKSLFCT